MTDQHFTLFETPIGTCGIEWGPRGINGVQLPMGSDEKTRARIRQRDLFSVETAATAEVQAVIDRILDLLSGKPDDLRVQYRSVDPRFSTSQTLLVPVSWRIAGKRPSGDGTAARFVGCCRH